MRHIILSNEYGNVVIDLEKVVYVGVDPRKRSTVVKFDNGDTAYVDQAPKAIYDALADYDFSRSCNERR